MTTLNYSGQLVVNICWCGMRHAIPRELYDYQQRQHVRLLAAVGVKKRSAAAVVPRAMSAVYHADALDVIAELERPVDAVVTDPPYASGTRTEASKSSSGAMLRAGRFSDRPLDLDQMTTQGFVWLMRAVARGVYPILADGGSFACFQVAEAYDRME